MPERDLDLEAVAALIQLVETHDLEEISVEDEGVRVVVRRDPLIASGARPSSVAGGSAPGREAADSPLVAPQAREALVSPMVGVFYRAPAPDQPAYIEIGDRVEVGQTIGIIEAMKVFSEIPADHAGVCVEIAARSGQLVQAGEPLLYLSPEA